MSVSQPSKWIVGGWAAAITLTVFFCSSAVQAQIKFEQPPISYYQTRSQDPMQKLADALEAGALELSYSSNHGWLPSLLHELAISVESQLLVFSKTSLQLHKISPRTPRALYFNDNVYVGWCVGGDKIEVAATDPQLGAVFYTVDQQATDRPQIRRDRGQCLTCHATYRTQAAPGYLVRSIFSDHNGRPRTGTRTYVTDHTTDFKKRFGGWFVTGDHGDMRHMGNVIARDRADPELLERDEGANVRSLAERCDTSGYLRDSSDIVALMVLEHQSQMHNLIARASMETRVALHYDRGINEALGRPLDTVSPSSKRRIQTAGEKLIRYLLFADEIPLTGPIEGTPAYREQFEKDRRFVRLDSRGRSLRQFDLKTRMFKVPCSYLIYSSAWAELPEPMATFVRQRLSEILFAPAAVPGYEHLSKQDRQTVREILHDTYPGYLIETNSKSTTD